MRSYVTHSLLRAFLYLVVYTFPVRSAIEIAGHLLLNKLHESLILLLIFIIALTFRFCCSDERFLDRTSLLPIFGYFSKIFRAIIPYLM